MLTSCLRKIVGVYIEDPVCFLHDLDYYQGLIIGEAALAFIHRDVQLLSDCLEIAVGKLHRDDLEAVLTARHWLTFETTEPFPYDDRVPNVRVFRTPNKQYIKLVCSPTDSALGPVALQGLSALANYVSNRSFGSAFPLLTLRRLSLFSGRKTTVPLGQAAEVDVADGAEDAMTPDSPTMTPDSPITDSLAPQPLDAESVLVRRLERHGFRFRTTPLELLDPAVASPRALRTSPYVCLHNLYVCPDQSRYFGDNGSFVAFFDVVHNTTSILARQHYAPYNPSAAWRFSRLWGRCERDCIGQDELLLYHWQHQNLLILPRMVHYGPRFVGDRQLYSPAEMVRISFLPIELRLFADRAYL